MTKLNRQAITIIFNSPADFAVFLIEIGFSLIRNNSLLQKKPFIRNSQVKLILLLQDVLPRYRLIDISSLAVRNRSYLLPPYPNFVEEAIEYSR